jgi:hypothetical protein
MTRKEEVEYEFDKFINHINITNEELKTVAEYSIKKIKELSRYWTFDLRSIENLLNELLGSNDCSW